jgi:beta-RFAP synthase
MSQLLGRGAHSGIGIAAFQAGGFVVDGGHRVEAQAGPPPVLFRHPLPEAWRFLVAIPAAPPGISGESEQRAFRELPPAPAALAERICRLLVMRLLPGLIEQDIAAFGTALSAIQELVGESFATIQGGRFANSISGDLIGHLLEHGAAGAGQSSWGPALYAVAADSVEADRLAALAREFLAHRSGGDVFVVSGANAGASCRPT